MKQRKRAVGSIGRIVVLSLYWACIAVLVIAGTTSVAIQVFAHPTSHTNDQSTGQHESVKAYDPKACQRALFELDTQLMDYASRAVATRHEEGADQADATWFDAWDERFQRAKTQCPRDRRAAIVALETLRFRTKRLIRAFRKQVLPLENVILHTHTQ